ncbi:hypothetical protein HaLaN_11289 [Haematococcus lacustris]|uniref:Uncharacterized protein n=1 Tax=Haematococcus lacustris TaxID=44745 RepID=A0A699YZI8_HAELA|nr:hypothetical protein HaLaN_11289 [Haematococcus lacustris]
MCTRPIQSTDKAAGTLARTPVDYTWVRSKLASAFVGLKHATRRAMVTAKDVLHVTEARLKTNRPNCRPRIKLSGDRVQVTDVQLLQEEDGETGVPAMPAATPAPSDIMVAVESMDSVFMEQLNGFLWEVEERPDFPFNSFEESDSDALPTSVPSDFLSH